MKTVMITGATSGIGEACARVFAEQKYNLILTGRRIERLQQLSDELNTTFGVKTLLLNFDIQIKSEVIEALSSVTGDWQQVDVLINNAGLSRGLSPIQDGEFDDWDEMLDTNVKGLLYVSKIVTGWMLKSGNGHIVNLGSIAGKQVYPNGNVYCASKFAVDAITQAMRIDLLPHHIKVTSINPGAVKTAFSNVRFHGDTERADLIYKGFEPLNALDVAETIWWVANRPAHVNINDLTIMPAAQASSTHFFKNQ